MNNANNQNNATQQKPNTGEVQGPSNNAIISEVQAEQLKAQTLAVTKVLGLGRHFASTKETSFGAPMISFAVKAESGIEGITPGELFDKSKEKHIALNRYMTIMVNNAQGKRQRCILLAYNKDRHEITGTFNTGQELTVSVVESFYQAPSNKVAEPAMSQATGALTKEQLFG